MNFDCSSLPYKQTGFFSKLVADYIEQNAFLQDFYNYPHNLNGIKEAIQNKQKSYTNRSVLVDYFKKQYQNTNATDAQLSNISLLSNGNSFTVTTAHQPNIFTGPLYFIYKIVHAIKMANDLQTQFSDYSFIPVYYMGSEDADLDELGNITIQQKKLVWNTNQTGAVGRMKVDKDFIRMINEIEGQIAVNEFGKELIDIFRNAYTLNDNIQQSTFNLVNTLFGKYGLLVLIPDNADLKRSFIPIVEKELKEQFSGKEVTKTVAKINEHYKLKQTGRALNLFYLIDDTRERIEFENDIYKIEKLNLSFSKSEILEELNNYPERFSANVILRPVFQETILPNIAFIGGGGEISYWLQLKNVFEKTQVDFPPIFLRNSFLFYYEEQERKLAKMNLHIEDLFLESEVLFTNWIKQHSDKTIDLNDEINALENLYRKMQQKVEQTDLTLVTHTQVLAKKAVEKLNNLEKKLLRAEKRKHSDEKNQLLNIKKDLFPNNSLQERTENFSYLYSIYGSTMIDTILQCSNSFNQQFSLIKINKQQNKKGAV